MTYNDAINRIRNELERHQYEYSVRNDRINYEIYLKDTPTSRFYIVCRRSSRIRIIRIHWVVLIDSVLIEENRDRLLIACDLQNRSDFIKAKIQKGCVDITYEIPESAWGIVEKVVIDVIYYFYNRINLDLFQKALYTDEDLYQYYDGLVEREMEDVKRLLEKYEYLSQIDG